MALQDNGLLYIIFNFYYFCFILFNIFNIIIFIIYFLINNLNYIIELRDPTEPLAALQKFMKFAIDFIHNNQNEDSNHDDEVKVKYEQIQSFLSNNLINIVRSLMKRR